MQNKFSLSVDSSIAVPDDVLAYTQQLRRTLAQLPPLDTLTAAEHRAKADSGAGPFGVRYISPLAQERHVEASGLPLHLRLFVPPGPVRGVYLYLHGGGWTLGGAHLQDATLEDIAQRSGWVVVALHYRLAPEHPFPAAIDDSTAAAAWVRDVAAQEFATTQLFIGGDSAGAHLSVCALLRLRDAGGRMPFVAANLMYGAFDLGSTPSVRQNPGATVLPKYAWDWFLQQFVPPGVRLTDPALSPLYADLRGLPPAIFTVGTQDPLLDDSLFMHARWLAAGNVAAINVLPGEVHGFFTFASPSIPAAQAHYLAFLQR